MVEVDSMKKIFNNLKKFSKSKAGFMVMFFIVLPFFAISTVAGIGYYRSQTEPKNNNIPKSLDEVPISPVTKITEAVPQQEGTTSNPPQQTSTKPSSTTTSTKPSPSNVYMPFVCTETVIPFDTVYDDADYMSVGKSSVGFPGSNGIKKTCTADSNGYKPADFEIEPINRTIHVGTMPVGPTQEELETVRLKKIADCVRYMQTLSPSSTAYMQCYN